MDQNENRKQFGPAVPLSRFGDTEAALRIFDEVDERGEMTVVEDGEPLCVLMSPQYHDLLYAFLRDNGLAEDWNMELDNYVPREKPSWPKRDMQEESTGDGK